MMTVGQYPQQLVNQAQHKSQALANATLDCQSDTGAQAGPSSHVASQLPSQTSAKDGPVSKGKGRGKSSQSRRDVTSQPTPAPEKKEETKLVDYVTKCLKDYGMCVVDNFLGAEKGEMILEEVLALSCAGCLKDGQISSGDQFNPEIRKVRGDKITWVEKGNSGCAQIGSLINRLDQLMKACNGKLGTHEINGRTQVRKQKTRRELGALLG